MKAEGRNSSQFCIKLTILSLLMIGTLRDEMAADKKRAGDRQV